jgi:hypothetical protein
MLCPPGYVCGDGTGLGQAYRTLCPLNYFCPTGTADNFIGSLAGDSVIRNLSLTDADPYYDLSHVKYLGVNDVRIISQHDKRCFDGIDNDLNLRYDVKWSKVGENLNNPFIEYLNQVRHGSLPYQNISLYTGVDDGKYYRPSVYSSKKLENMLCGRDHKWDLVNQAIYRKECNCVNFFKVIIAVYRLWLCTGENLENLGLGSINSPYRGTRDYWFLRKPLEQSASGQYRHQCSFKALSNPNYVNLTHGAVFHDTTWPSIGIKSSGLLEFNSSSFRGLQVQRTWTSVKHYSTFNQLKTDILQEFQTEYVEFMDSVDNSNDKRTRMDPYIFDLYWAIKYVDEYGKKLEDLVWLTSGVDSQGDKVFTLK